MTDGVCNHAGAVMSQASPLAQEYGPIVMEITYFGILAGEPCDDLPSLKRNLNGTIPLELLPHFA